MLNHRRILTVLLVSAFAATASAVPWSNPSGSATFFDWDNGQNATGLFGSPILSGGNTFVFFPAAFRAESTDGAGDPNSAGDVIEVDLIAHAGFEFTSISITEFGDYGILNSGQVSASGMLEVGDLVNARPDKSASILTSPAMPITTTGTGQWQGSAGVSMVGDSPAWTQIHLTFTNDLVAISAPGSSTYIQKSVVGSGIALEIIPEPASLSLLALGAFGIVRRKRR